MSFCSLEIKTIFNIYLIRTENDNGYNLMAKKMVKWYQKSQAF